MKIDIKKIDEGEESIVIRYKELTSPVEKIISILDKTQSKIWGRVDDKSIAVDISDVLYLESVDEKVFAYTKENVIKIDGSLNSLMMGVSDDTLFRCAKSVVININHVVSLKSLSSNRIDATMESGEHIIISRRYESEFRRLLKGER